jgi:hypothetical protein
MVVNFTEHGLVACHDKANNFMDFFCPIRFNGAGPGVTFERLMKKLVLVLLLIASPAWAQTKLTPKTAAATRADPCAPIGRTADGKLVYSMKCDNLPVPPPPPQAEIREAPPPVAEKQRSGIFGWSYDTKVPDQ